MMRSAREHAIEHPEQVGEKRAISGGGRSVCAGLGHPGGCGDAGLSRAPGRHPAARSCQCGEREPASACSATSAGLQRLPELRGVDVDPDQAAEVQRLAQAPQLEGGQLSADQQRGVGLTQQVGNRIEAERRAQTELVVGRHGSARVDREPDRRAELGAPASAPAGRRPWRRRRAAGAGGEPPPAAPRRGRPPPREPTISGRAGGSGRASAAGWARTSTGIAMCTGRGRREAEHVGGAREHARQLGRGRESCS